LSATVALIAWVSRHSHDLAPATGVDEDSLLAMGQRAKEEHDQLRADLERVTAERDQIKKQLVSFDGGPLVRKSDLDAERAAHAETKAALERSVTCIEMNRRGWAADRCKIDRLRREWALYLLEDVNGGVLSLNVALIGLPESVAALIRAGAGKPIGECDNCKQRAPLMPYQDTQTWLNAGAPDGAMVCAWGCSEKGASDGG
jgi:hypothetical protein